MAGLFRANREETPRQHTEIRVEMVVSGNQSLPTCWFKQSQLRSGDTGLEDVDEGRCSKEFGVSSSDAGNLRSDAVQTTELISPLRELEPQT